MTLVHAPPNEIERIETIWAVLSVDDTGEGICGANIGGKWMTLTVAKESLVPAIVSVARDLANLSGKKLRLVKMTMREDVQEIVP